MMRGPACEGTASGDAVVELVYLLNSRQGPARAWLVGIIDCLLAADDCASAALCSPTVDTGVTCDDETAAERCDGDVQIQCDRFATEAYTEHRMDCHDDLDGNARCVDTDGWARCAAPGACEGETTVCEGDVVVSCDGGVPRRSDCSLEGRKCAVVEGDARCVVAVTGCTPCDGDVAQQCSGDVVGSRLDCASFGMVCVPERDGDDGDCQAAEPACGEGNERCVDDVAEVCVWGRWWASDCGLVGATCATRDDAVFCDLP
jgi:hypothetical protein